MISGLGIKRGKNTAYLDFASLAGLAACAPSIVDHVLQLAAKTLQIDREVRLLLNREGVFSKVGSGGLIRLSQWKLLYLGLTPVCE